MAYRTDPRGLDNPFAAVKPGGRLMVFGRPTLMWDHAPTTEDFFMSYGFSEVHSLDTSDYEGATFQHDLNNATIPLDWRGQYRAVLAGGTIEHVYNIGNALKAAVDLLEPGGVFICEAPVNNWIDHGFWQICPGLKFDYFAANNCDFLRSYATLTDIGRTFTRRVPVYPGEGQKLNFVPARVLHTLEVIKTATSSSDQVPLQSLYARKHEGKNPARRFRPFRPYDIVNDEKRLAPLESFNLPANRTSRRDDGAFAATFLEPGCEPSLSAGRPFRSRAIVFEDGRMMDWIVSDEAMVADRPGSFAHFGRRIVFSTSDGSDPRDNGRHYDVGFYASSLLDMTPL